jgi:cell division protein ZapA
MSATIDIKLQGREFRVACQPEEKAALLEAVAYLEEKMNEIAAKTRGSGERLAVMTALNITHEFLAAKNSTPQTVEASDSKRRIQAMEARLDAALAKQEDLF